MSRKNRKNHKKSLKLRTFKKVKALKRRKKLHRLNIRMQNKTLQTYKLDNISSLRKNRKRLKGRTSLDLLSF